MKQAKVTYDTKKGKWIAYDGWLQLVSGTADQVDQWLKNSNEYEEYV